MIRSTLILTFLAACGTPTETAPATEPVEPAPAQAVEQTDALAAAIAHDKRTDTERARDDARHPYATLAFFEVKPTDNVLELWAGGGWYSHILAPYLAEGGHLTVTQYAADAEPAYRGEAATAWEAYRTDNDLMDSTTTITVAGDDPQLNLDGTVDVALTFRNAHGWVGDGTAQSLYEQTFKALKPGGTFGVVDHRASPGTSLEDSAKTGYIDQQAVIDAITAVGFEFVEASEVNANPLDTKDHSEGVWTLPPSYKLGDDDREKYATIGESDRMTLKFRKPAN